MFSFRLYVRLHYFCQVVNILCRVGYAHRFSFPVEYHYTLTLSVVRSSYFVQTIKTSGLNLRVFL
jgi:hypothetical protein